MGNNNGDSNDFLAQLAELTELAEKEVEENEVEEEADSIKDGTVPRDLELPPEKDETESVMDHWTGRLPRQTSPIAAGGVFFLVAVLGFVVLPDMLIQPEVKEPERLTSALTMARNQKNNKNRSAYGLIDVVADTSGGGKLVRKKLSEMTAEISLEENLKAIEQGIQMNWDRYTRFRDGRVGMDDVDDVASGYDRGGRSFVPNRRDRRRVASSSGTTVEFDYLGRPRSVGTRRSGNRVDDDWNYQIGYQSLAVNFDWERNWLDTPEQQFTCAPVISVR